MVQEQILQIIKEERCLFGTEIIVKLRTDSSTKEWVRKALKKLRQYNEIGFVQVTYDNQHKLAKQFPYLKKCLEDGYKVRRVSFLYFDISLTMKEVAQPIIAA